MAVIGTLGDIAFSVSRNTVKTFDGMKWDSSVKYASHDRHLKETLLEFTGIDADSISFDLSFSVFLGTDPTTERKRLVETEKKGKILRLILGGQDYGKWVIEKLSKTLERFDNKGNLLSVKISVSLKEYAGR